MNRREWLNQTGRIAIGSTLAAAVPWNAAAAELPEPTPARLPRWRGFNLLSMFMVYNKEPFPEDDFVAVSEFGFDFVRLPMDYRCWTDPEDWTKLREADLKRVDEAVGFGEKHGVHVQINFHRAPGYTVAKPAEERSVWTDSEALDVCTRHWTAFAKRYQGIPNRQVSFNLFNEPDNSVQPEDHRRVVAHLCDAIRVIDPERLIVCDGRSWANIPPTELKGLNVATALHSYQPMPITHYKASWTNWDESWPRPEWPLRSSDDHARNKAELRKRLINPWRELEKQGMGVHVGEFGCHNKTPHPVVLAWMKDCLDLFKEADWGWTLWNLRGSFGVMDSQREDVAYEDWRGHKIDPGMMKLLQAG